MMVAFDPERDEAYVALPGHPRTPGSVVWTAPIDRGCHNVGIYVDFNAHGQVIGIECLHASALMRPELLNRSRPFAGADRPRLYRRRTSVSPGEASSGPHREGFAEEPTDGPGREPLWATYDPVAKMGSIYLCAPGKTRQTVAKTVPLDGRVLDTWVMFDFDAEGYLVKVELNGSAMTPEVPALARS